MSGPVTILRLHYEGAIAEIILRFGRRLISGILGDLEIVSEIRAFVVVFISVKYWHLYRLSLNKTP